MSKRAINGLYVLFPVSVCLIAFGLIAATLRSVHKLSIEFHDMSNTQQALLFDIRNELNMTKTDEITIDDMYNQFKKMYEVTKLVCMLQPQYKEYCKLL